MTRASGRFRVRPGKQQGMLRYEGPFGPFEGMIGGQATHTRLTGPAVGTAELPWGKGTRSTVSDVKERLHQEERLRQGITAKVGDLEVRLHQPTRGFLRSHRAIWVERPDRPPARLRLRRIDALSLERADGTRLARIGSWFVVGPLGGVVTPAADAVDVALLLLAYLAGLDEEVTLGA